MGYWYCKAEVRYLETVRVKTWLGWKDEQKASFKPVEGKVLGTMDEYGRFSIVACEGKYPQIFFISPAGFDKLLELNWVKE